MLSCICEQTSLLNTENSIVGAGCIPDRLSFLYFCLEFYALTYTHRDKFLKLDAPAHEALQIFQVDKHPSYMGIGRAKEGY
jgi:hypothetical protein